MPTACVCSGWQLLTALDCAYVSIKRWITGDFRERTTQTCLQKKQFACFLHETVRGQERSGEQNHRVLLLGCLLLLTVLLVVNGGKLPHRMAVPGLRGALCLGMDGSGFDAELCPPEEKAASASSATRLTSDCFRGWD